jgi:hypothetical protein
MDQHFFTTKLNEMEGRLAELAAFFDDDGGALPPDERSETPVLLGQLVDEAGRLARAAFILSSVADEPAQREQQLWAHLHVIARGYERLAGRAPDDGLLPDLDEIRRIQQEGLDRGSKFRSTADLEDVLVFLCHFSGDKPAVKRLQRRLHRDGVKTWMDASDLLPGQNWDHEIRTAVRRASAVVVCLSEGAVTRTGYLQKEIRFVLDVAEEQPPGAIFVIPARLEGCDVPERLRAWHWVDLWRRGGYKRLLAAVEVVARGGRV